MIYLLVAAALVLVAAFALRSSSSARTLTIAGAAIVMVGTGLVLLMVDGEREAPPPIELSALSLEGLDLSSDRYGQQLKGRVANRSARRLGTIELKITYRECPAEGACRTVDEETHQIFMALAPKQTGGFSILLQQGELSAKPGITWVAAISAASADF